MESTHYHVLVGLCGAYLPDDNQVYRTRPEAEDAARRIAEEYREEGERVSGSARAGFVVGAYRCIEVTECDVAECLEDLDE